MSGEGWTDFKGNEVGFRIEMAGRISKGD